MKREIQLPFDTGTIASLQAFDRVLLSGTVLVGRDQVHQRLSELLQNGEELPVPLQGETMYYMGPSATPDSMVIGSCGPTTSARMDRFVPALMEAGLIATIGKGPRSPQVTEAIRRHGGVYLIAFGGCGALYATKVVSQHVLAFGELGPEALVRLEIRDFPAIVGIDSRGNSVFD